MTKTVLAIIKIKPGSESAFEVQLATLFEKIQEEPGCRGVSWGATETPLEYALVERYADQAAIDAHRASEHMKKHGPILSAMFDGAPTLIRFTEQGSDG